MRLDKYLKVSTLIKRRTLAKAAAQKDLVFINDKLSKPSSTVKVGDIIRLEFSRKIIEVKVTSLEYIKGGTMFILVNEQQRS